MYIAAIILTLIPNRFLLFLYYSAIILNIFISLIIFYLINEAEQRGAEVEELKNILSKGRAMKGMFEGNLTEGELETGQVSSMINTIMLAAGVLAEIWNDYLAPVTEIIHHD